MNNEKEYPQFYTLFGAYLNQDSDYWGDTLQEVVACYRRDSTEKEIKDTLFEIDKFKEEFESDLDGKFYTAYGYDFDPELWGYTTASFFDELKKLLQE